MDNKPVRLYVNVDEYEGVGRYEPDWVELTKKYLKMVKDRQEETSVEEDTCVALARFYDEVQD